MGVMSQVPKVTSRDAWLIVLFYGALAVAAMWFGRGYTVGGFIPAPLFVGALAAFFIVNVIRAARHG